MPAPAAQLDQAATGTGAILATSSSTIDSGGSSRPAGACRDAAPTSRATCTISAQIARNSGVAGDVVVSLATRYSVSALVTNPAKSNPGPPSPVVTARALAGSCRNF